MRAALLLVLLLVIPIASAALAPAAFTTLAHHDGLTFVTAYADGHYETTTAYAAQFTAHTDTDPGTFRWSESTTSPTGVTTEDTTERLSDGAALESVSHFEPSNTSHEAPFDSKMVYDAPCIHYAWPLDVGKNWTSICSFTSNGTGMPSEHVAQTTHYAVTREERITVPAGTFDAFVIEASQAGSSGWTEWYSPTACSHAKVVGNDPQFGYTTTLAQYDCSGAPNDPNSPSNVTAPTTRALPTATTTTGETTTPSTTAVATTPTTPPATNDSNVNVAHRNQPAPGTALILAGVAAVALLARRKRS